jgi:hypothetical protein
MIAYMHFVHKFKNSLAFLPISYEERVKEVLYENGKHINIRCKTTMSEPYLFTICLDYAKALFQLPSISAQLRELAI